MIKRPTILVLDDDAEMLRVLSEVLSESYEVFTASDAMQALDLLKIIRYDLFITDLSMPLLSGAEFIRMIRYQAKYDRMPILVISGYAQMAEQLKGVPVTATLQKPVTLGELLPCIEKILNSRQAEGANQ